MKKIELSNDELRTIQRVELEVLEEVDKICKKHGIKYVLSYGALLGAVRHKGFIPWDDDIDICILREDFDKFREICCNELDDRYFYQSHDTDKEYYYLWDKIRVNNTLFKETFVGKYNIHHGIYIDVFPIDNISDNNVKFKKQYLEYKFFKSILMAKYIDLRSRNGKKKIQAYIIKILFAPFSLEFLYNRALKAQTRYRNNICENIYNFATVYGTREVFPKDYYLNTDILMFEGKRIVVPKEYDKVLNMIYGNYMKLPPKEQQNTRHDLCELKFDCM